jgi:glycine/D-amino acid oxidase-like deaminating enzyme
VFARRAQKQGATFLTNTTVTGVKTENGTVTGVETEDGILDCDVVVNAAGPWSPRLAQDVGLDIPVAAFRRQVLVAEPPNGRKLEHTVPMVIESRLTNKRPGIYFRDEIGEGLLLGYFSDDEWNDPDEVPVDPDDYSRNYDQSFALKILEQLEHRAPEFADFPVTNGWAGLHITSADGEPILDRHPNLDGYYLATGFSGKGFQISPMTGELITDLILHGEPRAMGHLEPYRLERFDDVA